MGEAGESLGGSGPNSNRTRACPHLIQTVISLRTQQKIKNGWCWWGGRAWPPLNSGHGGPLHPLGQKDYHPVLAVRGAEVDQAFGQLLQVVIEEAGA